MNNTLNLDKLFFLSKKNKNQLILNKLERENLFYFLSLSDWIKENFLLASFSIGKILELSEEFYFYSENFI